MSSYCDGSSACCSCSWVSSFSSASFPLLPIFSIHCIILICIISTSTRGLASFSICAIIYLSFLLIAWVCDHGNSYVIFVIVGSGNSSLVFRFMFNCDALISWTLFLSMIVIYDFSGDSYRTDILTSSSSFWSGAILSLWSLISIPSLCGKQFSQNTKLYSDSTISQFVKIYQMAVCWPWLVLLNLLF